MNTIINGNSLEVLKTFEDNSIDSIVTDPPYELGFMGKAWDSTGIANNVELWQECLRVLKPGGHLLAFSGTRTYHRMACAIEDAGFEVRDMIEWVYGSGFPKSLNIGKAVDKLQGNERESLGKYVAPDGKERGGVANNPMDISNYQKGDRSEHNLTKGTSEWEGWGTALKPAHEPICMARKPLNEKTVASNVLKYGTGGINIDECRVEANPEVDDMLREVKRKPRETQTWEKGSGFKNEKNSLTGVPSTGRFPANLIHDGSDEVVDLFPYTKSGTLKPYKQAESKANVDYAVVGKIRDVDRIGDSGSAARFFYCAKTSKDERNKGLEGFELKQKVFNGQSEKPSKEIKDVEERFTTKPSQNNHPTVKPIKLMSYLCRLITPKGGTVLDPFNGSGSTGCACVLEGFNYIGIDLDPEYCKISEARIKAYEEEVKQDKLL